MTDVPNPANRVDNRLRLGHLMFLSRWLQVPLYMGLIVAQAIYVWLFMLELGHLISEAVAGHVNETDTMLIILGLVDVVMIANLLIMVIVGGYETFVSRINLRGHPDEPEWLSHVNANVLKVKLATAIIGISSIHLLKTFISADQLEAQTLLWQTVIHLAFVVSAVALAVIDRMQTPPAKRTQAPERNAPGREVLGAEPRYGESENAPV